MTEAPRWRLIEPHYLNILRFEDGTLPEWQYEETARDSGRRARKLFKVPALLDNRDAACFNYPQDGDIIVAHDAKEGEFQHPRDIIFEGKPTPGMEPVNAEAEAITNAERHRWENPIESLPANGGMNGAETAFMEQMMKAFSGVAAATNQAVPKEQYDALLARVAALETAKAPVEARRA